MSVSPTPSPVTVLSPSLGVLLLAATALVVLLICVIVAFVYGRKLQTSSFDRGDLMEAVAAEEKLRLIQKLDNDKWSGPIDSARNPLPTVNFGKYNAYYFWGNQDDILNTSDVAPSNQADVDTWNKLHKLKMWGSKELQLWNSKTAEVNNSADTDDLKRNRIQQLSNKSWAGPIDDTQNPLPADLDSFYNVGYFWSHQQEILNLPDVPPNNQPEVDEWNKKHSLKVWGQGELKIYDETKKSYEKIAMDKASAKVPKSTDVIKSGGLTFVLEFSTIMVIIFTLVILGILGILPGNEISAILAAIAGYVLGRAATSAQQTKGGNGQTPPPTQTGTNPNPKP